jgi:hypothetical protein
MSACIIHYAVCIMHTLCSMHYAYIMHFAINVLTYGWVNSLIIVDFSHRKWHPTRHNVFLYASIWVKKLCIMQLTYCILYIEFCMSKFIKNIGWLFPSKMTPHKAQCVFIFVCIHMSACIMCYALCIMHYALCIMHYVLCIMQYAWVNSLIILVNFPHQKWHPTRHSVHLFFMHPYECIHYALCN